MKKTTFALFFGNRGFFPASLQQEAQQVLGQTLRRLGHEILTMPEGTTRNGAVENRREGEAFAAFLARHRGEYGGVIVSLPNFGDESGVLAGVRDSGVPLLIQAFPDELDRMGPAQRRDAFCGKFSVMNLLVQHGVPFTALPPHTVHPSSPEFAGQVDYFDRLCRVVSGLRRCRIGAIGARTTPFKTVRIDETTLERHGITVETYDLSTVFSEMKSMASSEPALADKMKQLRSLSDWSEAPAVALERSARLGVVLDRIVAEDALDCVALRCWEEMQRQVGISPCSLLAALNDRGVAAACEVDVGSAVMMRALHLATGESPACLDWNNNYGNDPDRCILFHCGPVPSSLMAGRGKVVDQAIIANAVGPDKGFGCNAGRIRATPFTFGNLMTREGRVSCYLGEGNFTDDPIPQEYFGCAGVAAIPGLQAILQKIGYLGHRHHVTVAAGKVLAPAREAMTRYLGYEVYE